jgi:glycine/D-amino acid oxidase-like deaminating enzyme
VNGRSTRAARSGERVVLIGGGVSAALSAVRLAERGLQVTVLEKAGLGNGSSSRSMAGIRAQFGVLETVLGMSFSKWYYQHFHDLLETPAEQRQPVIRQNGYLFLYDDPSSPDLPPERRPRAASAWERAQRNAAQQRAVGVPVELLEPSDIARQWPFIDAERLIGATWCPTDGFLFPIQIYGEGFRRAVELGATVVQRAEVLAASLRGGRLAAVETSRGRFEADYFVNCTNAWAPRTSQRLGGMPLAITPIKRYLYLFRPERRPLSEQEWERLPMTIFGMGSSLGAHYRPEGDQLLLAGNHDAQPEPDFRDEDQDLIAPGFHHLHGIDNLGLRILQEIAAYAPELAESGGLTATTSGYYGLTPDASPLIGFDTVLPNLLHAAGFSGHGVMHAPITALLVESLLLGAVEQGAVRLPPPFDQHRIDLHAFDPARDFSQSTHESAVL